jgi:hypothetical protein
LRCQGRSVIIQAKILLFFTEEKQCPLLVKLFKFYFPDAIIKKRIKINWWQGNATDGSRLSDDLLLSKEVYRFFFFFRRKFKQPGLVRMGLYFKYIKFTTFP